MGWKKIKLLKEKVKDINEKLDCDLTSDIRYTLRIHNKDESSTEGRVSGFKHKEKKCSQKAKKTLKRKQSMDLW